MLFILYAVFKCTYLLMKYQENIEKLHKSQR